MQQPLPPLALDETIPLNEALVQGSTQTMQAWVTLLLFFLHVHGYTISQHWQKEQRLLLIVKKPSSSKTWALSRDYWDRHFVRLTAPHISAQEHTGPHRPSQTARPCQHGSGDWLPL